MRITTAILPAFLLILAAANCKGDDTPENVPGDFGEPCVDGALVDTPDGCVAGLKCDWGFCEEGCVEDKDCRTIEGWDRTCFGGRCLILCGESDTCPDTLETALVCDALGTTKFCKADDGS